MTGTATAIDLNSRDVYATAEGEIDTDRTASPTSPAGPAAIT